MFKYGFVKYIWGNVSVFDFEIWYFVIKFSGVSYEEMIVDDMVVVDLDNYIIEGKFNFFLDMFIYVVLYCLFF